MADVAQGPWPGHLSPRATEQPSQPEHDRPHRDPRGGYGGGFASHAPKAGTAHDGFGPSGVRGNLDQAQHTAGQRHLAGPAVVEVRVGTSGWIYPEWRGPFYPPGLGQAKWLQHYAGVFAAAEINATFYRLPTQAAVARWRESTPSDFEFAWKASRFITHMKRLKDPEASIERVYAPMMALGPKLGPALFQLPPQMSCDVPRLRDFLALLPAGRRHVLEFRHPSWYSDAVLQALADRDAALCISDHHHAPSPWVATASFVYIRGHGPGGRYRGAYSDRDLEQWAERLRAWQAEGRPGYAFFDNDIGCAAPGDAQRLRVRLSAL